MPLKRMLEEGRSFGPKGVALLLEAFDGIVAELDLRSAADREKAAKIVMRLALGQAHLDGAKLRHDAIGLMRKEGIRGRRRALKKYPHGWPSEPSAIPQLLTHPDEDHARKRQQAGSSTALASRSGK